MYDKLLPGSDLPDPSLEIEMAKIWAKGLIESILPRNRAASFLIGVDPGLVAGVYLWLLSDAMDGPEN